MGSENESRRPPPDLRIEDTPISAIMTGRTFSARSNVSLEELEDLLLERHISAVPIVDDRGRPIGLVEKADIVRAHNAGPNQLSFVMRRPCAVGDEPHHEAPSPRPERARDVMNKTFYTLSETATLGELSALMAHKLAHHVLIVGKGSDNEGVLLGIVSSLDVLRIIAERAGRTAPSHEPWQ
jgi:CBS domain-containing protein